MPRCMICVSWSARWRKCWIEFDIVSCVFDDRSAAPGGYLYKKSPSKRAFIKSWDWRLAAHETHDSQIAVAKNCYICYPCDDVDIDHSISPMIIDEIVSVPNCAGVIIQSDTLYSEDSGACCLKPARFARQVLFVKAWNTLPSKRVACKTWVLYCRFFDLGNFVKGTLCFIRGDLYGGGEVWRDSVEAGRHSAHPTCFNDSFDFGASMCQERP